MPQLTYISQPFSFTVLSPQVVCIDNPNCEGSCHLLSDIKRKQTVLVAQQRSKFMDQMFVIDPETIECPLCNELLCPPVHQCRNGHVACATCCAKLLGNGCPFCRAQPIAHSRCLAVEKILESLRITCQYAPQGCKETVKYAQKEEHEKKFCEYRPMQCPVGKCKHVGTKVGIPEHFDRHIHRDQIVHLDPVRRTVKFKMADLNQLNAFVLVIAAEGLLLVHQTMMALHDVFFCSSFGSHSKPYRLKVQVCGGPSVFTMEALALDNQETEEIGQKSEFLLVPNVKGSRIRQFNLELRLL